MRVVAINTVKIGGKTYLPNDEFDVKKKDFDYLIEVGAVEEIKTEAPIKVISKNKDNKKQELEK